MVVIGTVPASFSRWRTQFLCFRSFPSSSGKIKRCLFPELTLTYGTIHFIGTIREWRTHCTTPTVTTAARRNKEQQRWGSWKVVSSLDPSIPGTDDSTDGEPLFFIRKNNKNGGYRMMVCFSLLSLPHDFGRVIHLIATIRAANKGTA
mmetsp:Transcript_1917/g.2175  ORF Transcript_1917/g.2175 Transcript_1917/m.2175 type:complete len:148 (+) Transcript_1917:387-830(+)